MINFDKLTKHYKDAIARWENPTRRAMSIEPQSVQPQLVLQPPPNVPFTFLPLRNADTIRFTTEQTNTQEEI